MKNDVKPKYYKSKEAAEYFGISQNTLREWDKKGYIKAIRLNGSLTGHRRYDIGSFSGKVTDKKDESYSESTKVSKKQTKKGIVYCRVSSRKQKDDLERQIEKLQKLYPQHEVIKDIGSGINFKRPGFLKLIEQAINKDIEQIVVAHRDRIVRFGFEFIKWLLEQYGVELVVLAESDHKTSEQELAEDLLAIVHVFSCRQNGKRKYRQANTGGSDGESDQELIQGKESKAEKDKGKSKGKKE